MIAALRLDGVRGAMAFPGALDGPAFGTFVADVLAPRLRPGDAVVMDNLKAHRSDEADAAVRRAAARFLRLPPYSPGPDPIGRMSSKPKAPSRSARARTIDGLIAAMRDALRAARPDDITGWSRHGGYPARRSSDTPDEKSL